MTKIQRYSRVGFFKAINIILFDKIERESTDITIPSTFKTVGIVYRSSIKFGRTDIVVSHPFKANGVIYPGRDPYQPLKPQTKNTEVTRIWTI